MRRCAGLLALGDFHGVSTQRTPEDAAEAAAAAAAAEAAARAAAATRAAANGTHPEAEELDADEDAAVAGSTQQQAQQAQQEGRDMPDLQLAAELALTCYELYRRTPAGLAPEIVHFSDNAGALRSAGIARCADGRQPSPCRQHPQPRARSQPC